MIDVLAFVILGIFVLSPLVAYVGTFRRQWGRGAYRILAVYYACFAVLIFAPMYVSISSRTLLDHIFVIALLLQVMAGPLVAMCVLAVPWGRRAGYCHACEYDLTGNTSGRCPECGEAVDEQAGAITFWQRMKGLAWRKFLVVYGVLCLGFMFGVCYTLVDGFYCCSECGVSKSVVRYEFNLPCDGPTVLTIDGPTRIPARFGNPLTQYLDPDGSCKHKWIGLGYSSKSLFYEFRGSGPDIAHAAVACEPDFPAFVAAHPGTLERIRGDLRKRISPGGWLMDEYFEWKKENSGGDSAGEGNGSE